MISFACKVLNHRFHLASIILDTSQAMICFLRKQAQKTSADIKCQNQFTEWVAAQNGILQNEISLHIDM